MTRSDYLASLIGTSWQDQKCWPFVVRIQRELFGRTLPHIVIPDQPQHGWMVRQFATHEERKKWRLVPPDKMGLMKAPDGSIALMAALTKPPHAGVWLMPENRIIHADAVQGVSFEDLATVRAKGFKNVMLFVPA